MCIPCSKHIIYNYFVVCTRKLIMQTSKPGRKLFFFSFERFKAATPLKCKVKCLEWKPFTQFIFLCTGKKPLYLKCTQKNTVCIAYIVAGTCNIRQKLSFELGESWVSVKF